MNPEPGLEGSKPKEEPLPSPLPKQRSLWLPLIVLAVVFLAGFAPMWLKTIRLNAELSRVSVALRQETLQLTLASAALDARRGDYEPARQRMASFFNLVAGELTVSLDQPCQPARELNCSRCSPSAMT